MSEDLDLSGLNFGWIHDPVAVAEVVSESQVGEVGAVGLSPWDGKKTINLGLYMDKLHGQGKWTLNQGTCGSCVAFGAAMAADILIAIDVVENGNTDPGLADPMTIYGGSRVQIGKGRIAGQGSVGAWAAKWLKDYGVIPQMKYPSCDLSHYDSRTCCSFFGSRGCPEELIPIAKQHPVTDFAQAKTRQDVGDAIANGHPVTVASNQGFTKTRNDRGVSHPSGVWGHQMCIIGVREDAALIINSWGDDWNSGPLVDDQPPGSFWAEWDVVVKRMLAAGDSWALAGVKGWSGNRLNLLGLKW